MALISFPNLRIWVPTNPARFWRRVGPSSSEGAQLTVRGEDFFCRACIFFLGLLLVAYVFVVYISLRDDGR
jgi:hypothetical protein